MKRKMKWKLCSVLTVFALMAAMIAMPVKAALEGGTDLTEDSSKEFIVKDGQAGSLDLKGFKQSGKIVIEKGGKLTIKDSSPEKKGMIQVTGDHAITNSGTLIIEAGTVDSLSDGKAAVNNELGATTTISGGKFLKSSIIGTSPSDSGGNSFYTILNKGTMTINGGSFENKGDYSSMIENGWFSGKPSDGVLSKLTITGGTFTSGYHAIKNDSYGDLKISGGNFTATRSGSALLNWNRASITGGTFTSQNRSVVLPVKGGAGVEDGILNVSGGTFNSATLAKAFVAPTGYKFSNPTITGGSFNGLLGATLAKEYKMVVENGRNVVKAKVPAITLSEIKTSMELGTTITLTATRTDEIEGDIVWASSNPAVATVTNGVIKTLKAGVTNITATADGKMATCEVQVYKPLEKPVLPTPPVNNGKDTTIEVNEKTTEVLTDTIKEIVNNVEAATGVSPETKAALKEAIAAGKQISVEAKTEKVDVKKVETTVVKEVEKVIAKDAMIAQYFDLSMMIKAGGTDLGTMNELSSKASFTVSVPTDLTKEGRTFYMVRIHNGVAEKIAGTLKGNEFTFESDKFSLFALVYEDAKPADTGDKEETVDKEDTEDKKDTTVDTGDTTETTSLLVMIGAASLILGGLLLRKRLEK